MAEPDSWEADDFEIEEPKPNVVAGAVKVRDRWEGEDEEEEVKDNWDDEEETEEANKQEPEKTEQKVTEKKKLMEKIKEKEKQQKKRQEELKKRVSEETQELSAEEQLAEKLRLKKLQEDSDLELAKEAFGECVTGVTGIDAIKPSSREDFAEFEKLLKEKITQYEKSLYYAGFLESLIRDVCISLEIDDLKKITNSLTVLCSEKQKQEKQSKAKKKKKGVVPGGGLKATMKNDLADYGGLDEGYVREYEDFM
ncbi:eukaryotic translation initiation factor 3 subunit J isoform 4-T4 [Pelodytes ibericus]